MPFGSGAEQSSTLRIVTVGEPAGGRQIQDFLVNFYPIIRDFPQWLRCCWTASPETARSSSATTSAWKNVHDAMWRAMETV